jgi:CRISPR/Cas system-associated exonuclease Cas4 (RecB family)
MADYLSISGLKNYLSCPEKYKKAQIERLKPIIPKAYFAFGRAIHKGIEKRIAENLKPAEAFQKVWEHEAAVDLLYNSRESHSILMEQGTRMLQAWESDITTQELLEVPAKSEVPISKEVDGVPLYGIVDFISTDVVIDWKTASSEYGEEKALDLQLPFYSLLLGDDTAEYQYGFGVLIKNKTPRVQYLFLPIEDTQNLRELIARSWEGILEEKFPRIPNSTCSFCDYLPLCLGKEGAESLYMSAKTEDPE